MKKLVILLFLFMAITVISFAQTWTTLASDPSGDGAQGGSSFLDGTKLEYRYDDITDSIWFRVTTDNFLTSNYGINIIMDVSGGGAKQNWFGTNSSFQYNRIITAWITTGTSGVVGVTDAAGFQAANYTKLGANNIKIDVNPNDKTYTLGLKRTDITNDTALHANVIAGVGSNQFWDDDVPNSGSGAIHAAPLSISALTVKALGYQVYPNPSSGILYLRKTNGNTIDHIMLFDMLGKRVLESTISNSENIISINTSKMNKGTYFLYIYQGSRFASQTILFR